MENKIYVILFELIKNIPNLKHLIYSNYLSIIKLDEITKYYSKIISLSLHIYSKLNELIINIHKLKIKYKNYYFNIIKLFELSRYNDSKYII